MKLTFRAQSHRQIIRKIDLPPSSTLNEAPGSKNISFVNKKTTKTEMQREMEYIKTSITTFQLALISVIYYHKSLSGVSRHQYVIF